MDQQPPATAELELADATQEVERRSSVRFPIEQVIRYRILGRNTVGTGAGRTLNMSSTGVLFITEHPLSPGDHIELSINWPVRLDHKCPLKLVTDGRVVRGYNGIAAISIDRYEFRTQGLHALA